MKATLLALACLAGLVCSGTARSLLQVHQAPAPAPGPNSCPTVLEVAQQNGLTTLMQALTLDNLQTTFNSPDVAYTVFAPTNEAFENGLTTLGRTNLQDVLFNSQLDDILQYHFLIHPYTEEELVSRGTVDTNFQNQTLTIQPDGTVEGFASNATIIQPNVQACKSIVQVIDNLLLPADVPNFNGGPYVAPPANAPGAAPASAPVATSS